MNELLVNVSDFVLPLIIISAAFGGLCAFVAILGVKKETHRFARFCKDAHLSSEEVRFEGRKEKLKEQIERLSKNKKMARVGQGKLYLRVFVKKKGKSLDKELLGQKKT